MPPAEHHKILFEPVQIGRKTLRNRFYNVPHGTSLERPASLAAYRAMRAEGGWAAVSTEWAPVSPSTGEWPFRAARIWDDHDAGLLVPLVTGVHSHGALAGIELHHGGALSRRRDSRMHALSPSGLAGEIPPPGALPEVPKAMDRDDIEAVQQSFVDAAIRARAIGFDIIYVYAACGFLFSQFLSPYHNKRNDEYGGTLENRARMWLETLDRVKAAVGDDCAIATRLAVDARGPWGHPLDETVELVRMADEYVDLWDLNMGGHLNMEVDITPSRGFPEGANLAWFEKVRAATAKPVVGVSRLTNPDLMATAVRNGLIDVVGCARQSIADPFLPAKVAEGRVDEIRECTGMNACLSSLFRGHLGCVQNATAGEEHRRGWHPERYTLVPDRGESILIVGAGPAGLECAIVLAKRGLRAVHLVDAEPEPGGIMRWIPRIPGLREWGRFLDHRLVQLDKLEVLQFIPRQRLDAQAIRDYGATIVVVATGSRWSTDGLTPITHEPLPGADSDLDWIFTPEQLMLEDKRPPAGSSVVVYDAEGYFMGAGMAELLAIEGYQVSIVTPFEQVAPECDLTGEGVMLRNRLHGLGIEFHRNVVLGQVEKGRISGEGEFGTKFSVAADALVLVTHRLPNDELYRELSSDPRALAEAGITGLYHIGDAVTPRILADAVFDGHRLGREIDEPNPSKALPIQPG